MPSSCGYCGAEFNAVAGVHEHLPYCVHYETIMHDSREFYNTVVLSVEDRYDGILDDGFGFVNAFGEGIDSDTI